MMTIVLLADSISCSCSMPFRQALRKRETHQCNECATHCEDHEFRDALDEYFSLRHFEAREVGTRDFTDIGSKGRPLLTELRQRVTGSTPPPDSRTVPRVLPTMGAS